MKTRPTEPVPIMMSEDYLNDQLFLLTVNPNNNASINNSVLDLIDLGADVNFHHWTGTTPLINAVQNNFTEMVDCLLQNEADVNLPARNGGTALEVAAANGNAVIVNKLCLWGAKDVNKALDCAVQSRHLDVVMYLIQEQEADVNNTECGGWTPLSKVIFAVSTDYSNFGESFLKSLDMFEENMSYSRQIITEIREKERAVVLYLLEVGADVNAVGEGGMTPLGAAASVLNFGNVELLIRNGADVNKCDPQGNTPLAYAAKRWHADVVRQLIGKGADVDKVETGGQTPLAEAAATGHLGIVKILIENGANLNPIIGYNPLIVATKNGHREVAKYLVTKGANVNKMDAEKNSALLCAVKNCDFNLTEFLLDNGAHNSVHNVFLSAVSQWDVRIIDLLVKKGADVNMKFENGVTPLMKAVDAKRNEAVLRLIVLGADPNKADDFDNLPLIKAIRNDQVQIAETLIEKGATVSVDLEGNNFPLDEVLEMYCIQRKHTKLIKLLIRNDTKLDSVFFCKCGCTLLTKFIQMDDYEMTTFLVQNSADVNEEDGNRNLPLIIAASNRNYQIIDFLVKSGADIKNVKQEFEKIAKEDISFRMYLKSLQEKSFERDS